MKITIWEIVGYSDYDGKSDNNICFRIAIDSSVTKNEVENLFYNRYASKYRIVTLTANKIEERIINN